MEEGNELMRDLENEFEVNDIGELKMIIGVKIHQDRESQSLTISQKLAKGYATVVGAIGYAAMLTQPDIQEAYQILSKFTANPGAMHCASATRVLNGT